MKISRVMAWLVGIPFGITLLLVLTISFYEARKAYWDRKVTELCEKDGGVVIFEQVRITKEEYERLGGVKGKIPLPREKSAPPNYPFVAESVRSPIRSGDLQVYRTESLYKRRADSKVLAKAVSYWRVGGDFPIFDHASQFSCPNPRDGVANERQLFVIEE